MVRSDQTEAEGEGLSGLAPLSQQEISALSLLTLLHQSGLQGGRLLQVGDNLDVLRVLRDVHRDGVGVLQGEADLQTDLRAEDLVRLEVDPFLLPAQGCRLGSPQVDHKVTQ